MTYVLEINDKCPSWNEMMRMNTHKRLRACEASYELIYWAVYQHKGLRSLKTPLTDVWIHFSIQYKEKRRHDNDNAFIKPYQDGLVKAGVIVDDACLFVKEIAIATQLGMPQDKIVITINEV